MGQHFSAVNWENKEPLAYLIPYAIIEYLREGQKRPCLFSRNVCRLPVRFFTKLHVIVILDENLKGKKRMTCICKLDKSLVKSKN